MTNYDREKIVVSKQWLVVGCEARPSRSSLRFVDDLLGFA